MPNGKPEAFRTGGGKAANQLIADLQDSQVSKKSQSSRVAQSKVNDKLKLIGHFFQFFHSVAQLVTRDIQQFSGLCLVATAAFERLAHQRHLHVIER